MARSVGTDLGTRFLILRISFWLIHWTWRGSKQSRGFRCITFNERINFVDYLMKLNWYSVHIFNYYRFASDDDSCTSANYAIWLNLIHDMCAKINAIIKHRRSAYYSKTKADFISVESVVWKMVFSIARWCFRLTKLVNKCSVILRTRRFVQAH